METKQIISKLCAYKNIGTKTEFAKFIGTTVQNINGWEERNTIDLHRICKAFPEVDANWLITGEGNMLKQPTIIGGLALGDGALNYSNSECLIERFINEIAEQRKVTQSVVAQNSVLLQMISSNNNGGSK